MVKSGQFEIETEGFGDILDITGEVARIVAGSGLDAGIAIVFVTGSTAGITAMEYEPGAVEGFKKAIDRPRPLRRRIMIMMPVGETVMGFPMCVLL